MKFKIYTLGCKLNFAESSTLVRQLESSGWSKAAKGEIAQKVIINSCSVTAAADAKARELIRRVVRENSGAQVIVTGCYARLKGDEIAAMDGVTQVEADKSRLAADNFQLSIDNSQLTTEKFFAAYSSGERVRAFLKIQDGCDYHCTYCTVWRARGVSRNAPIANIVAQAQEIAKTDIKEIVLTGVNIGDFGRSTGETFLNLLRELVKVDGIERYRISSIEPNLLTDDIINFCATEPKMMPHFHIPLQSGSDAILRAMGRRYGAKFFADKIASIRAVMANTFFGVDVIVGFPGESDDDFAATYNLLAAVAPSYLHIFPYSARANTPAATMENQVCPATKKERAAKLEELNRELQARFYEAHNGAQKLVLVEGVDKRSGLLFGHSENFLRVELSSSDRNLINTIVVI